MLSSHLNPLSVSIASLMLVIALNTHAGTATITLDEAINIAQQNDPWLLVSQRSQDALQFDSVASGTLPDPKVSLSLANLAADSFDFNQEPMTQVKIDVAQVIPRGDSLKARQKQLLLSSQQHPYQRQNRMASVGMTVSQHWLNAYKAEETIALIVRNRVLFEQLVDVAEARYASALGRTRQQDIVRAQLEITRLQDRLTTLHQQQDTAQQRLLEWLRTSVDERQLMIKLPQQLPDIKLRRAAQAGESIYSEHMSSQLLQHPALVALDYKIRTEQTGIELAKQQYKPEWGIQASYAYRDDSPQGQDRADFVSVGVTFDLPLFTENRQDKRVQAAAARAESAKAEKTLLLRKMSASYQVAQAQLTRLDQRQTLFQSRLLPQMVEQAEASLNAYTNDDGDFAEVVRARIAQLNAEIETLDIAVERQKLRAQINYFLTVATPVDDGVNLSKGEPK